MSEENGTDAAPAETDNEQQDVVEESTTSEEAETEEGKEAESEEQPDESEKSKKSGYQRRVDKLTWEKHEAERRAAELEKRLAEQSQPKPKQESKRPTLEDCNYDEGEFASKLEEWYDSRIDSRLTEREQSIKHQEQQRAMQQRVGEFHARGSKLADDWGELVANNDALPVTEAMRDALLDLEKGPEVLYHLASNPSEMIRIANLNPYSQAAEIGRLEVRLSLPKPSKTSSAPPPVRPLSAGGESVSKDPDDMTVKEWTAWRNKQLQQR